MQQASPRASQASCPWQPRKRSPKKKERMHGPFSSGYPQRVKVATRTYNVPDEEQTPVSLFTQVSNAL